MGTFSEVVVPIFGNILGCIMLLSPTPAVLRLRKTGKLGDINPLPYPMTAINCIGWVTYGYAIPNPAILPANILGFVAGVYFTLVGYACAPPKIQDRMAAIFVSASAYFIILGIVSIWGLSHEGTARMWGISAVVILMLYYLVPLSTMVTIVRTRNAASIYPPLAAAAIANGTLWTVYGLAVLDINIWLPNCFGTIIGVVQLGLRAKYGAQPGAEPAGPGGPAGPGARVPDVEAAFGKAQARGGEATHAVDGRTDSGARLLATSGPGGGLGPVAAGYAPVGHGLGSGVAADDGGGGGGGTPSSAAAERPSGPSA